MHFDPQPSVYLPDSVSVISDSDSIWPCLSQTLSLSLCLSLTVSLIICLSVSPWHCLSMTMSLYDSVSLWLCLSLTLSLSDSVCFWFSAPSDSFCLFVFSFLYLSLCFRRPEQIMPWLAGHLLCFVTTLVFLVINIVNIFIIITPNTHQVTAYWDYILSVPKFTANLYCICLSIPKIYT